MVLFVKLFRINEIGFVINRCWLETPHHFTNVGLDYYVIMLNHIHGIIIINQIVETRHASSLRSKSITLSNIVGSFKSAVSKQAHENGFNNFSWQLPERWIPSAIAFLGEGFTEQNKFMNSTLKMVHGKITEFYQNRIEYLYTQKGKDICNHQNLTIISRLK